ncbi:MAG: hypothetical protein ACM3UU_06230 [Ignavibacteriales bacterium]
MINVKGKKSGKSTNYRIIYIAIFVMLNILGIGYGSYMNNIGLETVISTGDIAPVFSSEPVLTEINTWSKPNDARPASAVLSSDQKKIYVTLPCAYPGYSVIINYTVSNMGTIPISCNICGNAPEPIKLNFSKSDEMLNPHGDSISGTIKITIPEGVKEDTDYSFAIGLEYDQYNLQK